MIFPCLLILINILTFITYGIDKSRARRGAFRIPEHTLLALAVIGGSIGALAGMRVFRHKTRKPRFAVGIPVILALQMIGLYSIMSYFTS